MTYSFDFGDFGAYTGLIVHGAEVTLGLTAVSTALGILMAAAGAWAITSGPRWLRVPVTAYVELIRNTPFLVQLFFIFFGLPSLGVHIDEMQAAVLSMTVNLGAYAIEILRAGIDSVPRGQSQASLALGLKPRQAFVHVVLPQALANVYPALVGQVLITMLGSAVVSQISVADLTYAANYIQSRNFRAFEIYVVVTVIYLVLSIALRWLLDRLGRRLFAGRTPHAAARVLPGRLSAWFGRRAARDEPIAPTRRTP